MQNAPTVDAKASDKTLSQLIEAIETRLSEGRPVRRSVPGGGRLHVDRKLPFLCCYLRPPAGPDLGTEQLVTGEASYLTATLKPGLPRGIKRLLQRVIETMGSAFGGFLLLEVWAGQSVEEGTPPAFRLIEGQRGACPRVMDALESGLAKVTVGGRRARVEVASKRSGLRRHAGRPLLEPRDLAALGCTWIGIEVAPVYRDGDGTKLFPAVLRSLRVRFGRALRQGLFAFVKDYTTHEARDSLSLGRRAMVKAVWRADEQLARVASSFDFLLTVNPTNADAMWSAFRRANYDKEPTFRYRPLPIDPPLMKRLLYQVPIDRIEDPTVASLFLEKQSELDRQLTMLLDRGTPRFLLGSQQQFGPCEPTLVRDAEEILERISSGARGAASGGQVDAKQFCSQADRELAQYRALWSGFEGSVRISDRVAAGLTVSSGHLLVARSHQSPASRVDALIQHEIGTHLVTYYNGTAQRFRQLCTGLAGYDELQEGLAVLAEYLVGGMTPARLRVLAGRVLAVHALIEGASFIDVFRLLSRYGFARKVAFTVTLRVFRGGGLTKDMVYLRGLRTVLAHLRSGGELSPLFVGKLAANHIGIVQELSSRGVLKAPPLLPRYLERPETRKRLERLRRPLHLYDLADRTDDIDR